MNNGLRLDSELRQKRQCRPCVGQPFVPTRAAICRQDHPCEDIECGSSLFLPRSSAAGQLQTLIDALHGTFGRPLRSDNRPWLAIVPDVSMAIRPACGHPRRRCRWCSRCMRRYGTL